MSHRSARLSLTRTIDRLRSAAGIAPVAVRLERLVRGPRSSGTSSEVVVRRFVFLR